MGVLNVEKRISTRFVCPTPVSAAPANKGRHAQAAVNLDTPHCVVEATLSTRGNFVDRTIFGLYSGHCPDAPILLGNDEVYAEGARQTGLTARRIASVALACMAGAAIGAGFVGLGAAATLLAHALCPAIFAAMSLHTFALLAIPAATISFVAAGALDNDQWATAHRQFSMLHEMEQVAARLKSSVAKPGDVRWAESAYYRYVLGHDWALAHASMELDGLRRAYQATAGAKAA